MNERAEGKNCISKYTHELAVMYVGMDGGMMEEVVDILQPSSSLALDYDMSIEL